MAMLSWFFPHTHPTVSCEMVKPHCLNRDFASPTPPPANLTFVLPNLTSQAVASLFYRVSQKYGIIGSFIESVRNDINESCTDTVHAAIQLTLGSLCYVGSICWLPTSRMTSMCSSLLSHIQTYDSRIFRTTCILFLLDSCSEKHKHTCDIGLYWLILVNGKQVWSNVVFFSIFTQPTPEFIHKL